MSQPKRDIIKFRRGTAAEWTASEPQPGGEVLRLGEPGYEKDTGKLKIGDGVTPWNSLDYIAAGVIVVEDIDHLVNEVLQAGSGIALSFDDASDSLTISTSGVSFDGHTHLSTDITDFNSSVSGLITVKDIIDGIGTTVNSTDGIYSINVNASGIAGTFDKISFNTTADPTIENAEIGWNAAEGTLDLGLENNVKIHIGEHSYFRIRNNTGSILRSGQAVYASDVHNNELIEASLYAADGNIREIRFIGLVLEDVDINQKGYAINFGHIEQLDTRGNGSVNGVQNLYTADEPAWVEGDILYVHPTEPGKLTKVEPKHSISAAIVLYTHQNNGRIFVRPTSYGHLDDNHDVNVSGVTNGQFLQYNSSIDYWVPSSSGNFTTLLVNGTGVSVNGHTHISSDITDFNIAVSGLLPTITNSGNNRLLTSDGTSTGINAESNFTHDPILGLTTIATENINNRLLLSQHSDISSQNSRIVLRKNRGTLDSSAPLDSGDFIGSILFSTINSSGINQTISSIDSYTTDASVADKVPTALRFSNCDASGTLNSNMFIRSDGVVNCTNGSIIDWDTISSRYNSGKNYGFEVYAIPSRELSTEESVNGSLSWCFARVADTSTSNNALASTIISQMVIPNSGTILDSDSNIVGQLIRSIRNSSNEYVDNGSLNAIIGNIIDYGHFPIASGTNPTTNLGIGLSVSPFAGRGNINTTYDIYLGPTQQNLKIDEDTIITGDGTISNRYGIFQATNHPNILNGNLTVENGLSAPTPIFDLGTVVNNVNINYGIDRQIQKITLDGSGSVNFLQGSGWPVTNNSVDVLLEITVTSLSSVLVYWDIVDEWYNEPDVFVDGKYLVLLRSMSPSVIQGHYIGKATQVTTSFITDENDDRIMAENGDFILF